MLKLHKIRQHAQTLTVHTWLPADLYSSVYSSVYSSGYSSGYSSMYSSSSMLTAATESAQLLFEYYLGLWAREMMMISSSIFRSIIL